MSDLSEVLQGVKMSSFGAWWGSAVKLQAAHMGQADCAALTGSDNSCMEFNVARHLSMLQAHGPLIDFRLLSDVGLDKIDFGDVLCRHAYRSENVHVRW